MADEEEDTDDQAEEDVDEADDDIEVLKSFKTSGYRVELIMAGDDVMVAITSLADAEADPVHLFPDDVWELEDDEDDEEIYEAFDEASEDWKDADVLELLGDFGYDEHGSKT